MPREFVYDSAVQQYRVASGAGKGQFISAQAVTELTRSYVEQSKLAAEKITKSLLDGSASVSQWEKAIAVELKTAHTNIYLIGRGGLAQMQTDKDKNYGIVGTILKQEYKYLRGFSKDVLAGSLSEAKITARTNLYLNALNGTYERGKQESHIADGYTQEKRIRHATESCAECIEYAAQGWQPIGTLPNPGDSCTCRSNCLCSKIFKKDKDKDDETKDFLTKRWGWAGVGAGSGSKAKRLRVF